MSITVHLPAICDNGHVFPSGIQRPPGGGFAIGTGPSGELAGGTLSYQAGVLSTEAVSAGRCPFPRCGSPAHVPDGVWDFTEQLVTAFTNLHRELAAGVVERLLAAETDDEVEAATAGVPELQELVRDAAKKPDRAFWKQVIASAAIAVLPTVIAYQSKQEAHRDNVRQIELAEKQVELAQQGPQAQGASTLDQEAINELVATILRDVSARSQAPAASPTAPTTSRPVSPGRNQPCWCGSGRKYKFCHLEEDKEPERR